MTIDAFSTSVDDAGEAVPVDPMTGTEMASIDEDKLIALGEMLAARRDEWVAARQASGVERRWAEDLDQYNGKDEATKAVSPMMDSVRRGFPVINSGSKPQRSTVFVNITRPKTNAAEARLANMLCPVDDRNWGIKPTPDPELTKMAVAQAKARMQQPSAPPVPQQSVGPLQPMSGAGTPPMPGVPGQPQQSTQQSAPTPTPMASAVQGAYPSMDAQAKLDLAEQASKAMQDEMDDQLIECDLLGEERMVIHDAAVLGTGILKGPVVVNRVRKAWVPKVDASGTVHVLEIIKETSPASYRVDPWDVYTDPGCAEDIHAGRGIFEKKNYTAKQIRELAKQPGYIEANISKLLKEGPQTPKAHSTKDAKSEAQAGTTSQNKDHYELWEYWGEFSPEDMKAAGVEIDEGSTDALSGCVIFVNDIVIKGYLNPIETGDLPYDFMNWERVDGSCWGYGMPYLLRPAQRVLNAAWRQLMDNSGLSMGPNIVVDPTVLEPADGQWQITGRKIWNLVDSSKPAKDAFAVFEFQNNGKEIEQIIELAMKFADDESSTPQLAQGEKGTAPDTVGGMTLLMNSSNVVLGRLVKQFDDSITRPHIRRYYDWNMAYSDKEEIKGDFQIDARGSSTLLVRDMMHQTMLSLGQYQASGTIAPMVNWEAWFKEVLKMAHVDPTDIMKTEAEIAQLQAAPPQATPEQIKAQATLQVAQINAQSQQVIAQGRAQAEMAYADRELQMAQSDSSARLQELQMKRDIAILTYTTQQKISIQDAQSQLANTAMQEQTKRELAAAELQMRANDADKQRAHEARMADHQVVNDQVAAHNDHARNIASESLKPPAQIN